MPQGRDLGYWRGGGQKFNFSEIQRNLVCVTHINDMLNGTIFWIPAPWGGAKKVKYHLISKIFKPNIVCLLTNMTNERYITFVVNENLIK